MIPQRGYLIGSKILAERGNVRQTSGERHPGHVDGVILERYFDSEKHAALNIGHTIELDTSDFVKIDYNHLVRQTMDFIKEI